MVKESKSHVNTLQAELKTLTDRIVTLEHHNLSERIEKLQAAYSDLEKSHNRLQGVSTVIGLLFAVMGSLGGYSAFQYWKINEVGKDSYELFVDHFQDKLSDTIDRVRLVQKPGESDPDLSDLVQMRDRMKKLDIKSRRFDARADLTESLRLFVNNDYEGAKREAEKLTGHENQDNYVIIRSLTLQALADIKLNDRYCTKYAYERLDRAIKINKGVPAAAFNAMALCYTDQVRNLSKMPIDDCESSAASIKAVTEAFKMALSYYRLAYDLKPTVHNYYRYLNNKVWLSLVLYNATRKGCYPEKDFLILVESDSIASFFSYAQQQIDAGKSLEQNKELITETEAEMLCLKTKLARQSNSNQVNELHDKAKKTYQTAIVGGLFSDKKDAEEAWKSFLNDELLEELRDNDKSKEEIKRQIKSLYNH
jgi:hypothetical protein